MSHTAAITICAIASALAVIITVFALCGEPSGRGASRDFNRTYGKYRVRYKDNKLSEPMCRDVAEDYAAIFGGRVEKI